MIQIWPPSELCLNSRNCKKRPGWVGKTLATVFGEISNSLVKFKHHFGGLGNSSMWHFLLLQESHCSLLYPGYFLPLKVVMMLLISGKLLEMWSLMLEPFAGVIVLVALFFWENKKEEEQLSQISRDETLSRLPLRLSTNRIVELVQLRDTVRPVILAGRKETVSFTIQKAERFRTELLRRGVLLVPVIWGEGRTTKIEKKGFGLTPKAASALPSVGEDFEKRAQSITAQSKLKAEIRFKAEIVSPAEWERWIRDQQQSEGVTPGEDVYIILRLDGRVRRSGRGMPDWQQIVNEVPPMEALLSKLER